MDTKDKLEAGIRGHLEKVAALRKRSEAISLAIQALRSSDEELMDGISIKLPSHTQYRRRADFDSDETVEKALIEILSQPMASNGMSFKALLPAMDDKGITVAAAKLRNILKTSPRVVTLGERDQTRYALKSA
jgi:hypothetical protein